MYHSFFIHSPVSRHLGCFYVLSIVNSAAMKIGVHVSFSVLVSSGYIPRRDIAVTYGGFWKVKVVQLCLTLRPHGLYIYSLWNSPGQNTGVGSLSLLKGIFPTQGSNPCLPHCRLILYQLSHKGSPRILEWVACPFASRSSWPRNWTGVSCIEGGFFTNWAIREALWWFYS